MGGVFSKEFQEIPALFLVWEFCIKKSITRLKIEEDEYP